MKMSLMISLFVFAKFQLLDGTNKAISPNTSAYYTQHGLNKIKIEILFLNYPISCVLMKSKLANMFPVNRFVCWKK